jgi:hypothetical protein
VTAVLFDLLGVRWSLDTDDPAVVAALAARLPPLRLAEPRHEDAREYETQPARQGRGLRVRNGDRWRRAASAEDAGEAIAADLCRFVARTRAGRILVHAGAVAWGGRVLLLPGPSGAGKSRLVEALVRRGATYLSDDVAVLDEDGRAHPFPRPLARRHQDGGLERVPLQDLGPVATAPLPVAGVALAAFSSSVTDCVVEPLTPGAALLALLTHTLEVRRRAPTARRIAAQVARGASAVALRRGDADAAAAVLLDWFAALPPPLPAAVRPLLVSGLFDLARREPWTRRRTVSEYLRHGDVLCGLDVDWMVYADPDIAPEIVARRERRGLAARTRVVPLAFEALASPERLARIAAARGSNPVRNANPRKDTPCYVALTWSKFELVERALASGEFPGVTHAVWIDYGIAHVARTGRLDELLARPPERIRLMRMHERGPRHVSDLTEYYAHLWGQVGAGCIPGSRGAWHELAEAFASGVDGALRAGFAPSEEQLLPVLADRWPELFEWTAGRDYPDLLDALAAPCEPSTS